MNATNRQHQKLADLFSDQSKEEFPAKNLLLKSQRSQVENDNLARSVSLVLSNQDRGEGYSE